MACDRTRGTDALCSEPVNKGSGSEGDKAPQITGPGNVCPSLPFSRHPLRDKTSQPPNPAMMAATRIPIFAFAEERVLSKGQSGDEGQLTWGEDVA